MRLAVPAAFAGLAGLTTTSAAEPGAVSLRDVPVFEAGTEFELRFLLDELAYPLVVHVDPRGRPAVVNPPEEPDALAVARAGDTIAVPDPASGLVWSLSGEPGYETFMLVACAAPDVDIVTLQAELNAVATAAGGNGRAGIVRAVESFLTHDVGPTRSLTILHLP